MENAQEADDTFPLVGVYYNNKRIGMYLARTIGRRTLVLRHGAISFPVGTALRVHFKRITGSKAIRKSLMAVVKHNGRSGMLLSMPGGI